MTLSRPLKLAVTLLALGAVSSLNGCSKQSETAQQEPRKAQVDDKAQPSLKQAQTAEPSPEQVPIAEDFEAPLQKEITAKNYKEALDKVAAEIAADSK